MRLRRWQIALTVLAGQLLLAAPAMASDDGEGLAGELNDKIITFFALGVLLFFTLVIFLGTFIQTALENRKHAREEVRKRGRSAGW
jgi:hypothetical protein